MTIGGTVERWLKKQELGRWWRASVLAGAVLALGAVSARSAPARAAEKESAAVPFHGRLEVSSFYLEAPDELLRLGTKPDQRPVWRLQGGDPKAALVALAAAGLGTRHVDKLASSGVVAIDGDRISILPGIDLLLALSAAERHGVYSFLAGNGLNQHHAEPQIIFGNLDEWLRGSALSSRQQTLLRGLVWHPGGVTAFSDVSALVAAAETAAEAEEARRVMTRVRALRVRVVPPADKDGARFVDYWTAGGLNRSAAPLLNSAIEESGGGPLDLTLLLPPLARERLYTYPSLQDAVGGRLPDCNWTSLNFFAHRPESYYLDGRTSYLALTQLYAEIPRADRFGDVLAFVTADGLVQHTCVLVAEDIVFTKNGQKLFAPWLLQRISEVADIYGGTGRVLRAFRLRPTPD